MPANIENNSKLSIKFQLGESDALLMSQSLPLPFVLPSHQRQGTPAQGQFLDVQERGTLPQPPFLAGSQSGYSSSHLSLPHLPEILAVLTRDSCFNRVAFWFLFLL